MELAVLSSQSEVTVRTSWRRR
jgi:hypothetical protein